MSCDRCEEGCIMCEDVSISELREALDDAYKIVDRVQADFLQTWRRYSRLMRWVETLPERVAKDAPYRREPVASGTKGPSDG